MKVPFEKFLTKREGNKTAYDTFQDYCEESFINDVTQIWAFPLSYKNELNVSLSKLYYVCEYPFAKLAI